MRLRRWCLPLLIALSLPAAGAQEYHVYNVSASEASSNETAVACADDGSVVVAWVEAPGEVWTRRFSGAWSGPVLVGNGADPCVAWSGGQFLLAYASGTGLVLWSGDGASWGLSQTIQGGGQPVTHPDLTPAPAGAAAQAYAVWQEMDTQVWFSQRVSGTWSAGQLVVDADPMSGEALPQVAPTIAASQILPRVYYFDALSEIRYRQRAGGVWSDPVEVPGRNYAIHMDVAAEPSFLHHIICNGPQPGCPCNHLNYIEELSGGGWAMVQRLDVELSEYNWPKYMSVAVDVDDEPRILWYQLMHDAELEPDGELILYRVREEGVWTDHSDLLGGHVGQWTGLAIDPQSRPVFVWTEEVPSGRDAMLCRFETSAGSPDPRVDAGLRLAATPNPARGRLDFILDLPGAGEARLEIFDAAGRCLERVLSGARVAGAQRVTWEPAGAPLPPGVYQARLASGGREAVTRLVLID